VSLIIAGEESVNGLHQGFLEGFADLDPLAQVESGKFLPVNTLSMYFDHQDKANKTSHHPLVIYTFVEAVLCIREKMGCESAVPLAEPPKGLGFVGGGIISSGNGVRSKVQEIFEMLQARFPPDWDLVLLLFAVLCRPLAGRIG
jgi:hypothetical protein